MHPGEVIGSEVERQSHPEVVPLPAEGIGEPDKATYVDAHVQVLPLDARGADRSSSEVPEMATFSADIMAGSKDDATMLGRCVSLPERTFKRSGKTPIPGAWGQGHC